MATDLCLVLVWSSGPKKVSFSFSRGRGFHSNPYSGSSGPLPGPLRGAVCCSYIQQLKAFVSLKEGLGNWRPSCLSLSSRAVISCPTSTTKLPCLFLVSALQRPVGDNLEVCPLYLRLQAILNNIIHYTWPLRLSETIIINFLSLMYIEASSFSCSLLKV